jgi:hypothetical protein
MNIQRVNYNVLMVSLIKTDVAQTKASKALVRSSYELAALSEEHLYRCFVPEEN